jgi:hypothetical protein
MTMNEIRAMRFYSSQPAEWIGARESFIRLSSPRALFNWLCRFRPVACPSLIMLPFLSFSLSLKVRYLHHRLDFWLSFAISLLDPSRRLYNSRLSTEFIPKRSAFVRRVSSSHIGRLILHFPCPQSHSQRHFLFWKYCDTHWLIMSLLGFMEYANPTQ